MVDSLSAIATVVVVDRFGWTTFAALAEKQVSKTVNTAVGAVTTVDIIKMSLSPATHVRLSFVHYSSLSPRHTGPRLWNSAEKSAEDLWLRTV